MRKYTQLLILVGIFLTGSAVAGPTASDLNCLECVEAGELADDAIFTTTMLVRADGTFVENCNALLDALDKTSAVLKNKRYLIKLEAGIYECEFPKQVIMNKYVDIEGSGQQTTVIRGFTLPVVEVAENSELRQVKVEARGPTSARGIDMRETASRLSNVTVSSQVDEDRAGNIPSGVSIGPRINPQLKEKTIEVDLDHVTVIAGTIEDPLVGNGTAFQIGGPARVRMTDVQGHGGRTGLAIVNSNSTELLATGSLFRGGLHSLRVEDTNRATLVSSQLPDPLGQIIGTAHCIASFDSAFNVLNPDCTSGP